MPTAKDGIAHRTLYEIIWSCLFTIIACTWIALHPDVPRPTSTHSEKAPSRWNQTKKRLKLTIYAVIAPELIILWAIGERLLAKRIANDYNRFYEPGESSAHRSRV